MESDIQILKYNGCIRKRTFNSKNEAIGYARKEVKLRKKSVGWYRCPFCKNFHLTTKVNGQVKNNIFIPEEK